MSISESLARVFGGSGVVSPSELDQRLRAEGLTIVGKDEMADAVHGAFCGVEPDHAGPNAEDRERADALMSMLYRRVDA
ncbi:MAG: hypothetical protein OEX05_09205 [Chloroflexota bacterium]|jgi:hypothetical protein|nr:hypothetical protein [Chloroflexota bacterium]